MRQSIGTQANHRCPRATRGRYTSVSPLLACCLGVLTTGCVTNPLTGRRALNLIPAGQLDAMGVSSFNEMKNENTIESDPAINAYVQCIVRPITVQAAPYVKVGKWEVVVFRSNQVNAFALPGGKIGVYTGILRVANKADQLAAVLGHEVGHVLAEHGNERVSQSLVAQGGLSLVSSLFSNSATHNMLMGLLSAGTQLGILLPFSRKHETEADLIGLKLMAPVGFDPRGAVELWQNMAKASGGRKTPEIFSTHPSDDTRIRDLQEAIPSVMDTYEQALASGKRPNCVAPKITQENLPEPPPAKNAPSAGSDSEEDDS